ncbi:MAG TPA: tetratricopeptide repeat protein [Humisphaera sp.]|nr:tetratricopeptide repeat protein [Humisphaera sp.]
MAQSRQLLVAGLDAMKRENFEEAETLLIAAFQAYPEGDDGRRTASIWLGKVYRQTGRYEEALHVLERGLPFPAAFQELVSICRFLGKAAKKDGDAVNQAEWYRRMFSLAMIYAGVMNMRMPHMATVVDWKGAENWLQEIRRQHGSLYAYQFEGQEVPEDTLLSAADYKVLRSHLTID